MCHIKRFSKHFLELFQSRQYSSIDWLFLIDNDLIVNVNFKMSFSQLSFYVIVLHWRMFQQNDILTKTIYDVFRCRILLLRIFYSSMFFYTYFKRSLAFSNELRIRELHLLMKHKRYCWRTFFVEVLNKITMWV